MPWITEGEKSYWMPEVLPEPTEAYTSEQSEKKYLTQEGKERGHPGWTYAENIAYVDDEYLFQNEGWKTELKLALQVWAPWFGTTIESQKID